MTATLGHFIDTAVILGVVVGNAVIGFIQEGRAEEAMEAIRGMLAPQAAVLRDGRRQSVNGVDLVPGDIVLVEAGDRVAADLRLMEARGAVSFVDGILIVTVGAVFFALIETEKQMRLAFRRPSEIKRG